MGSDRDSIAAMKRQSPLARAGAITGIAATVVGILSQVLPPVWNVLIDKSGKEKMQQDLAACQGDLKALKHVVRASIDASESRFVANEKQAIDLRGSVELISKEVSLRHGSDVEVPISEAPTNRWAKLQLVKEKVGERLESAKQQEGNAESLVETMRRKNAPLQVIDLGDR